MIDPEAMDARTQAAWERLDDRAREAVRVYARGYGKGDLREQARFVHQLAACYAVRHPRSAADGGRAAPSGAG